MPKYSIGLKIVDFVLHLLYWNNMRKASCHGQYREELANDCISVHVLYIIYILCMYVFICIFLMLLFSVFRNGDLLCPPFRFIIPRSMRQDLEQILSLVTEKVSLRTGAVRRWVTLTDSHKHIQIEREIKLPHSIRLCSLEGVTVSSAAELETGRCYVAVGTERFKKLPYVELLVSKATERYCYARSSVSVCVKMCVFFCICAGCSALQSVRHERIWTILFHALLSLTFLIFLIL